jgi:dienelactone hydrolase
VQGEETFDLKTVSPLFTLDRLRVPVLMMHGTEDQRVPYKQSKLFADALKLSGKPYEFYTLEGEGHGFRPAPTCSNGWTGSTCSWRSTIPRTERATVLCSTGPCAAGALPDRLR